MMCVESQNLFGAMRHAAQREREDARLCAQRPASARSTHLLVVKEDLGHVAFASQRRVLVGDRVRLASAHGG